MIETHRKNAPMVAVTGGTGMLWLLASCLLAYLLVHLLAPNVANANGALALGSSGNLAKDGFAFGASVNEPSQQAANDQALETCRKYAGAPKMAAICKVILTFSEQCYALVFDPKAGTPGTGWALGADAVTAVQKATSMCQASAGPSRRNFCQLDQTDCDFKDLDKRISTGDQIARLLPGRPGPLSSLCWLRVTNGRDLQLALANCTESLRLRPDNSNTMDSRGLVYLRLSRFDDAIADYDAALKLEPKTANSLYGRGVAKQRKGDIAGGNADIAAAVVLQSDIAEVFAGYGITAVAAAPPAADCSRAEAHWKSAEDIRVLSVYEDHLARFASCEFAALARARIEALKK